MLQESPIGNGKLKKACTDEQKDVPLSAINSQQRDEMKQLYNLEIPEDMYHFWDFCKELCPDNPCGKKKNKKQKNSDQTIAWLVFCV